MSRRKPPPDPRLTRAQEKLVRAQVAYLRWLDRLLRAARAVDKQLKRCRRLERIVEDLRADTGAGPSSSPPDTNGRG